MGKIGQVAQASARARGPLKLGHALVFRWRNRMSLLWQKRRRAGHHPLYYVDKVAHRQKYLSVGDR